MQNVSFLNDPSIQSWMTEEEKEFRRNGRKYVQKVVEKETELFGNNLKCSFFQEGVSSIVALIESEERNLVVKTNFKKAKVRAEALAFLKWSEMGIPTPEVYGHGDINEHSYSVMEYVDAPIVKEVIKGEDSEKKYYRQLGTIFAKIHTVNIQGFGRLGENDQPLLQGKKDTLHGAYWDYFKIEKSKLENISEVEQSLSVLSDAPAVIGHFDFGPHHAFATNPITIFDPDAEAMPAVVDLATFLAPIINESEDVTRARKEILQNYLESTRVDIELLSAALVLWVTRKAYYLRRLPDETRLKRASFLLEYGGTVTRAKEYLKKYFN